MTIYILASTEPDSFPELHLGYVRSLEDIPSLVERLIEFQPKHNKPSNDSLKIDLETMKVSWKIYYDFLEEFVEFEYSIESIKEFKKTPERKEND